MVGGTGSLDLSQVADKLYHVMLYRVHGVRTRNVSVEIRLIVHTNMLITGRLKRQ